MKKKFYFRGLGIGILITAILFSIGLIFYKPSLSDEEIKKRALELGMVESKDDSSNNGPIKPDSMAESASGAESASVAEDTSGADDAGAAASGDESASVAEDTSGADVAGGAISGDESASVAEDTSGADDAGAAISDSDTNTSARDSSSSNAATDNAASDSDTNTTVTENPDGSITTTTNLTSDDVKAASDNTTDSSNPADSSAPSSDFGTITISAGQDSRIVSRHLYEAGIVADSKDFNDYLESNHYDKYIMNGSYNIKKGASYEEIMHTITSK